MAQETIKLFHATSAKNIESIKADGLKSRWEGVYFTDSAESACRWIGFRLGAMGEDIVAVVEVEIPKSWVVEGSDHSPLMQQIFGCGESFLVPRKRVPQTRIKEIHYFKIARA